MRSRLIRINSAEATSKISESNFSIDLNTRGREAVDNVFRVAVKSIIFPFVQYNINNNNKTFTFLEDATPRIFDLPVGWYTIEDLITALQTNINSELSAGSVAVTLDALDKKLVFAFTGLTATTVTLDPKLVAGITFNLVANAANSFIVKAQSVAKLYGLTEVFLELKEIANGNMLDANTTKNIMINIPITASFGQLNVYEPQELKFADCEYVAPRSLSTLSFRLIDRNNNDIDIQDGHYLRLVLKLFYI